MTTAEKIYSASTSEDAQGARLAEQLARRIEDDIASKNIPPGGVMGSLRDLSEHYRVGRAAAREGVALLERRGLGRLRPGPCGGFIVAQPDAGTIGSELANFFKMAGITKTQLIDAREAVDLMAAGLAATAGTGKAIATLDGPEDGEGICEWHMRVREELALRSGEPVIELFTACLNDLTAEFAKDNAAIDGLDCTARHHGASRLRAALSAGDDQGAIQASQELNRELQSCLREQLPSLAFPAIDTARQEDDRTLATLVARRLAAEILHNGSAGQRIGSEWDLCERFSVSRATLRQAIRQVQDSGLVECRRGRGNGLVIRDLRGTGSIRLMLAFLISHQMDPKATGTILFQLNRFIPALAVSRATAKQRAWLDKLLSRARSSESIDRYDLLRLVQGVSQVADSPIVDLFSRCLTAYEARFHPLLLDRFPTSIQTEYFELLRRLLDTVVPEDPESLSAAKEESSCVMMAMSRNRPI
ncbi:DNA-binding FadR family transcriptional regulator [Altererythrobacter atlanticus]|uniref:Transcriptional regulator NanR n=1 Tax=Croceibacterium atlanticum TaxID=1267766 RepID=A0A0F7KQH6_9SPHN|nr:GntR family transcriptional regulator [Croceibacterium atlanticum]AKH41392.1 transcriptional regulator NanR [Croceibacterium atlanticum]MBB5732854.1 DNA-binding FadR family transcriptional regulator [Croceibacterium atlanticum]